MSDSLTIGIAGVTFSIRATDRNTLITPPNDPVYQSFLLTQKPDNVDIHVQVAQAPEDFSKEIKLPRLFDGSGAWQLYGNDNDYMITLNPDKRAAPLWAITADPGFTQLSATANASLVRHSKGPPVVPCPITYPLDQIILFHHMANRHGMIVHCAGLDYQGRGIIFPGPSGAGKSSVSQLLQHADGLVLLSDDRMVIRQENNQHHIYGTPWAGDAKIAVNRRSRLEAICFLTQGDENRLARLAPNQALDRLLPVASLPWYAKEVVPQMLDFCGELLQQVPAFELQFTLDHGLVDILADLLPDT